MYHKHNLILMHLRDHRLPLPSGPGQYCSLCFQYSNTLPVLGKLCLTWLICQSGERILGARQVHQQIQEIATRVGGLELYGHKDLSYNKQNPNLRTPQKPRLCIRQYVVVLSMTKLTMQPFLYIWKIIHISRVLWNWHKSPLNISMRDRAFVLSVGNVTKLSVHY